MKNTNKLLLLFVVFTIFINEGCESKSEPLIVKNAFEVFGNQTLAVDSNSIVNEKKLASERLQERAERHKRFGTKQDNTYPVGDLGLDHLSEYKDYVDLDNTNVIREDLNKIRPENQSSWEKISNVDLMWILLIIAGTLILFFFIINSFLKENKKVGLNNGIIIEKPKATNNNSQVENPIPSKNSIPTYIDISKEEQNKGGCLKLLLSGLGFILILSPLNPFIEWNNVGEERFLTHSSWLVVTIILFAYGYLVIKWLSFK